MQSHLEAAGFCMPKLYQKWVLNLGLAEKVDADIERYWGDFAKERITSAGRNESSHRVFKELGGYRSAYLDQLASSFDYEAALPFKSPDLHPYLLLFAKKVRENPIFGIGITNRMEEIKQEEASRLKIDDRAWDDYVVSVPKITRSNLIENGFTGKSKTFTKQADSGLIFSCRIDTRSNSPSSLPLEFFIHHQSNKDTMFQITRFHMIVPGMHYYTLYKSPSTGILGIKAQITMFRILSESF